jgi:RNA polymerase sigma-54 factor
VLAIVQSLEPAGVGARSLGECIALQLKQLDAETLAREVAMRVALEHLGLVAGQQLALLRRQLRCSEGDLEMALALVRSCHPRPGAAVNPTQAQYVIPDVFVRRTDHGWTVEINQATVPRVRVNQGYANLISRAPDHAMLRTQLQEARWLMRSLEIRNETLVKVARCIVQRQTSFFESGEEAMEPLILKDVAEAVEMHESTISRVTTAKYMHTPRGVFEFRYFFSSHVEAADGTEMSSIAIRAKIKKLISQENPEVPLSDAKLAEILSQEGIPVARRTVAKYREGMQIAPSNERKRAAARAS